MVMLLHFSLNLDAASGSAAALVRTFFQQGWMGVDLFFVLSGFLITGILYDAKGGQRYFKTFYARRALRIFPLYYGALAAYFLTAPILFGPDYQVPLRTQAWYWGYLGNIALFPGRQTWEMIGHFWSLAIEEQFYLLWPLVVFRCTREQIVRVSLAGAVCAFATRLMLLLFGASGSTVYHITPDRIDGLALGAFVAMMIRSQSGIALLRRWSWRVAGGAAALLGAMHLWGQWMDSTARNFQMMSLGYSVIVVGFAAGVAGVVTATKTLPITRLLSIPPLVTLGKYSYAVYVFHPVLLAVIVRAGALQAVRSGWPQLLGMLGFPAAMTVVSLACGYVSWHAYEKHFLKLKRRFEYSRGRPRVSKVAAL